MIKYKKHSGKPIISAADAMKEAICFGWIDTTAKRIDDKRYCQTYVKRNQNSRWSVNTLKYGKDLVKAGKMSPFGQKMYKEGLKKKAFDAHVPMNPEMPEELIKELEDKKILNLYMSKFSPSAKRTHFRHILYAKMPETKKKRVKEIISSLKKRVTS